MIYFPSSAPQLPKRLSSASSRTRFLTAELSGRRLDFLTPPQTARFLHRDVPERTAATLSCKAPLHNAGDRHADALPVLLAPSHLTAGGSLTKSALGPSEGFLGVECGHSEAETGRSPETDRGMFRCTGFFSGLSLCILSA